MMGRKQKLFLIEAKACAALRWKTTYCSAYFIQYEHTSSSQGEMWESTIRCNSRRLAISESRKEECVERKSIKPFSKSLPVAAETGVVLNYSLIGCVALRCQQRKMLSKTGQSLSLLLFTHDWLIPYSWVKFCGWRQNLVRYQKLWI